jgi:hypothetical protein
MMRTGYMLRDDMMGWFTLMLDTSAWSEEQRNIAKNEIQLYKLSCGH